MPAKKKSQRGSDNFRLFLRDLGVRAFDQLASRSTGRAAAHRSGSKTGTSTGAVARLATYWSGMNPTEKQQFFEQMIAEAQGLAATAPTDGAVETTGATRTPRRRTNGSQSKKLATRSTSPKKKGSTSS